VYSRSQTITKIVAGFEALKASSVSIGDIMTSVDRDAAFDSQKFRKLQRSFQTHVLSKEFAHGLRITTRSDRGRLHSHYAVALPFKVEGFDWDSFEQSERWFKLYKSSGEKSCLRWYKFYTKAYRRSMPDELRKLNHRLMLKAKKYGYGHIRVLPVRKNDEAYKWYLVKNIPKVRQNRDKGLHYFESWGLPTVGLVKVMTRAYNAYRMRLKTFCEGLHLTSDNYNMILKDILGNNWHWKCRDYIKEIATLPEGLYLPPHLMDGYNELEKTVKQYLVRTGQYVKRRTTP
jgi:hypothetical protein